MKKAEKLVQEVIAYAGGSLPAEEALKGLKKGMEKSFREGLLPSWKIRNFKAAIGRELFGDWEWQENVVTRQSADGKLQQELRFNSATLEVFRREILEEVAEMVMRDPEYKNGVASVRIDGIAEYSYGPDVIRRAAVIEAPYPGVIVLVVEPDEYGNKFLWCSTDPTFRVAGGGFCDQRVWQINRHEYLNTHGREREAYARKNLPGEELRSGWEFAAKLHQLLKEKVGPEGIEFVISSPVKTSIPGSRDYSFIRLRFPDPWDREAESTDPEVLQLMELFGDYLWGGDIASHRWSNYDLQRIGEIIDTWLEEINNPPAEEQPLTFWQRLKKILGIK